MSCPQYAFPGVTKQRLLPGSHLHDKAQCQPCYNEAGRHIGCTCHLDAQLMHYRTLLNSGLPVSPAHHLEANVASAGEPRKIVLTPDQSAFSSPTNFPFEMKQLESWRTLPYTAASIYYPYDLLSSYPFASGYGPDINSIRRKNATRETTSTLKAWLSEHRKNPYPTKGEKIMLAIITRMTLTQVSTWFANARRRLKKENKMTWESKNKGDDDGCETDLGDEEGSNPCKEGIAELLKSADPHNYSEEDADSEDEQEDDVVKIPDERRKDFEKGTSPPTTQEPLMSVPLYIQGPSEEINPSPYEARGSLSPSSQSAEDAFITADRRGDPDKSPKPRIWSIVSTAISDKNTSEIHPVLPTPTISPSSSTNASFNCLPQYLWYPPSIPGRVLPTLRVSPAPPYNVPLQPIHPLRTSVAIDPSSVVAASSYQSKAYEHWTLRQRSSSMSLMPAFDLTVRPVSPLTPSPRPDPCSSPSPSSCITKSEKL